MATKTTNYNLTKPAYDEDADIAVINKNMDIIDTKMKEIENASGGSGGGGASAWSDITGKPFESIGSGLNVNGGVLSVTGGESGGSGVNYSTEEQVIGTWIDGKPLYRKVVYYNQNITKDRIDITSYIPANAKTITNFNIVRDGVYGAIAIAEIWKEQNDNKYYMIAFDTMALSNQNMVFVFEYTKTTD